MAKTFVRGYLWALELATGQWQQLVPPALERGSATAEGAWPLSRFGHTAALLQHDGAMWVFGGVVHQHAAATAELWRYSPRLQTWSRMGPATEADGPWPAPRAFHSMAAIGPHSFVVVGGESTAAASTGEQKVHDDTWAFDSRTMRWTRLAAGTGDKLPPTSRACMFALAGKGGSTDAEAAGRGLADGVLLVGGQGDGRAGEAWWLPQDLSGWQRLRLVAPAPSAALLNAAGASVPLGEAGGALVFGGRGPRGGSGDLWHLHGGGLEALRQGRPAQTATTRIFVQESSSTDDA